MNFMRSLKRLSGNEGLVDRARAQAFTQMSFIRIVKRFADGKGFYTDIERFADGKGLAGDAVAHAFTQISFIRILKKRIF